MCLGLIYRQNFFLFGLYVALGILMKFLGVGLKFSTAKNSWRMSHLFANLNILNVES